MDSSFSYQMYPKKIILETLKMDQGGVVLLGDNNSCKVYGIGTMRLKMFDNHEFLFHNVRYVLDLWRNLLSIIMFDDLGY